MFDHMAVETASIKTLSSPDDLSELMRTIKRTPELLMDSKGPLGHQPSKMYLRHMPGYNLFSLSCSYGSQDDYILATLGDTVIFYTDNTFCILPTGTHASVKPPTSSVQ